ncbi:hypothetical protein [Streptomyces sp. DSM 15324]|uniref:hypothetical protein n=1 Tax=Streptomyces sp. DSM 15324 TaxID=1739111 RepID=UPI0007466E91|nr:hypothetical protein [Streptomyces sp. DSM 15324]KUO09821.1 hypothetical protein AQJ58_22485 [Streptomyces sp. DSM 15324]
MVVNVALGGPLDHGQSGLRDVGADVADVMPPDAAAVCLPSTAAVPQDHRDLDGGGVRALGTSRHCHWTPQHVARWVDQARRPPWLSPGHLRQAAAVASLGLLASRLVRAGRTGDARPVSATIDGLVTPWPWGHEGEPLERYTFYAGRL